VIVHDDEFAPDTDDEDWLREAGRRHWVVLMKDDRIRYRPGEQRAIIESGVACFCLHPSKGMTGEEMAEALVTALPKILRIVAANPEGGYIRGVNRSGRVRRLFP
jgi:PIN like domain